ncbi:MAG: hypothetical protein GYB15_15640 [Gammaproteobacteria bacterium]|nr:hypothetical protein [Gammaproteobacteria bacterium]
MKSLVQIKEKIDLAIKNGGADSALFTYLFSHIRIVLEKKSQKQKYPFLSMVCNWYQHCEIDRSTVGYEVIRKAGDVIFDDLMAGTGDDEGRYDKVVRDVSVAFGMGRLKRQLHKFFADYDINPVLVDDKNWDRFLIGVLYDLSERPIRIPDVPEKANNKLSSTQKKAKVVRSYLEKRATEARPEEPDMVTPVAFSVELVENSFRWTIEMKSMIRITGALLKV